MAGMGLLATSAIAPTPPIATLEAYPRAIPWEQGQYVNYEVQRPGTLWEGLSIRLVGPRDLKGFWPVLVSVSRPEGQFDVSLFAKEPSEVADGELLDMSRIRSRSIRGQNPGESELIAIAVQMANNLLVGYEYAKARDNRSLGDFRSGSFCCSVSRVLLWNKPVESLNQTISYEIAADRVPILGVASLQVVKTGLRMRVVAYGHQSRLYAPNELFATYADFRNLGLVQMPEYSINVPTTWHLRPLPARRGKLAKKALVVGLASFGGRAHGGFLLVHVHRGTKAESRKLFDAMRKRLSGAWQEGSSKFARISMRTEVDPHEQPRLLATHLVSSPGQIGFRTTAVLLDQDDLYEAALLVRYQITNPERRHVIEVMKRAEGIVASLAPPPDRGAPRSGASERGKE